MILRRVISHVRNQEWTAIGLDFLIVVTGVFIGIQVSNWNAERIAQERREQTVSALATNLRDAVEAQQLFVAEIDTGLAAFDAAAERGGAPLRSPSGTMARTPRPTGGRRSNAWSSPSFSIRSHFPTSRTTTQSWRASG